MATTKTVDRESSQTNLNRKPTVVSAYENGVSVDKSIKYINPKTVDLKNISRKLLEME